MKIDDAADLLASQGIEDDDVIDAVQKLRLEGGAQHFEDLSLNLLGVPPCHLLNRRSGKVGGHDDQCILEVYRPPLPVCQASVFQDLKQQIEDLRVGFLDLVEQDHRIGSSLDGLGQESPLLVAHVAWRRANQPRHRVLFHELRHVQTHHGLLVVEQKLGQGSRQLRLAHSGRTQKNEGSDGPVLVLQSGTAPANRVGHRGQSLSLTDDPAAEPLFHMYQLADLSFQHLGHRNTGPFGHHLSNVFLIDLFLEHPTGLLHLFQLPLGGIQLLLQIDQGAVAYFRDPAQVAGPLLLLLFDSSLLDSLLQLPDTGDQDTLVLPAGLLLGRGFLEVGQLALQGSQPFL